MSQTRATTSDYVFLSTNWLSLYTEEEGSLLVRDSTTSQRERQGQACSREAPSSLEPSQRVLEGLQEPLLYVCSGLTKANTTPVS